MIVIPFSSVDPAIYRSVEAALEIVARLYVDRLDAQTQAEILRHGWAEPGRYLSAAVAALAVPPHILAGVRDRVIS